MWEWESFSKSPFQQTCSLLSLSELLQGWTMKQAYQNKCFPLWNTLVMNMVNEITDSFAVLWLIYCSVPHCVTLRTENAHCCAYKLVFWKGFFVIVICKLHPLWRPLCYSVWSYMVALGWLKCRLLSKGCCSSPQTCSMCQGLWSCMVSQRTGLLMNSDLAEWVLPGLLAKKTLLLIQGRGDYKSGGTEKGRAPFCVSHT